MQSVFNATARVVFSARKSEHITPLLRELHLLKVPERIQFRLCVLAYRCIIRTAPSYLAETLHLTADVQCRFTSASSGCFYVDAGHTVHTTHHAWWSSLPGDCCWSVECSSVVCSFCAVAAAVPPRPPDGTVSVIVLFTIVSSCVTDCNFWYCKVPLQRTCSWSVTLNSTLTLTLTLTLTK